jgi:signal transduction histidine kinase
MNDKLQTTLDSIGIAAHDMKNPIATIRLSAGIMAKMAKSDIAMRQSKAILESSYLLEHQVNMYRDLLRLETSGRIGLNLKRYGSNILELLFNQLAKTESNELLELVYSETESNTFIDIDLSRLTAAIKGICHTIENYKSEKSRVTVTSDLKDSSLEIMLKFNLKQEVTIITDDLFKKSYLGQESHEVIGSSVEMFLVGEIIKAHNGSIDIEQNDHLITFKLTINSRPAV